MADFPETDDQDRAEVVDETNLTPDGEDIANFDELADVFDATTAIGDAGEDEEADDGIETEEDVDAEHDARVFPRTRLEDRPDRPAANRSQPAPADYVPDDDKPSAAKDE